MGLFSFINAMSDLAHDVKHSTKLEMVKQRDAAVICPQCKAPARRVKEMDIHVLRLVDYKEAFVRYRCEKCSHEFRKVYDVWKTMTIDRQTSQMGG